MKGFATLIFFAVTYILLVLVFREISGAQVNMNENMEPFQPLVSEGVNNQRQQQEQQTSKFPDVRQPPNGSRNPLVDVFQVHDAPTMAMLDAVYGSYNGDDQCQRKSACIVGNYFKDLPGQNFMLMFLGGYIPPQYSLFFDIFRNSALYGQNCEVYVCNPTPTPTQQAQAQAKVAPRIVVV